MRLSAETFNREMATEAVRQNLGRKSVTGGAARILSQGCQLFVSFASMMVLGRLLTPEAFGIREMLLVALAFFSNFQDFGLPFALCNADSLSGPGVSRLFWRYMAISVLTAGLVAVSGMPLASWFGAPMLVTVMPIMALCVFVTCTATVPRAMMTRQMRHTSLAVVDVVALIVAVSVAIALAIAGAAEWALIAEVAVFQVVVAIGQWWCSGWLPGRPRWSGGAAAVFDDQRNTLLGYSAGSTVDRILVHLGRNSDRYLIGHLGGVFAMGLYGLATRWALLPMRQAYLPLLSVAVSGLSRVRNDPIRFRNYFCRGLSPVFFVTFPVLGIMAARPELMIRFVMGEQWIDATVYLRLLAIAAMFEGVHRLSKLLFLSQGATARQVRWGITYAALMILFVLGGSYWGALGIASGYVIGTIILTVPALMYSTKSSPVRLLDFFTILWRPSAAMLIALGVTRAMPSLQPSMSIWFAFPVFCCIFAIVYVIAGWSLPGGRQEAIRLLGLVKTLTGGGVNAAAGGASGRLAKSSVGQTSAS